MMDASKNNKTSYVWKKPRAVVEFSCQQLFNMGKVIIPRLLPLIFIIEYGLYLYLKNVLSDEIEIKARLLKIFLGIFLFGAGGLLYMFVIYPYVIRYLGGSHQITQKWFNYADKFIYWKRVMGYWIEASEEFPGLKKLIFKTRQRIHALWLPEDQTLHPAIIDFIDSHAQQIEPSYPKPIPVLSNGQWYFCLSFIFIFSVAAAILIENSPFLQSHAIVVFFVLLLFPGTISLVFALGKEFFKDKYLPFALVLNWSAFMVFVIIIVLYEFYKYHKIIDG